MLNVQNNDNSIKIQFKDGYPTVKYVIFGLLIFILIEINWIVEEIVKQRTNPLNFSIIFIGFISMLIFWTLPIKYSIDKIENIPELYIYFRNAYAMLVFIPVLIMYYFGSLDYIASIFSFTLGCLIYFVLIGLFAVKSSLTRSLINITFIQTETKVEIEYKSNYLLYSNNWNKSLKFTKPIFSIIQITRNQSSLGSTTLIKQENQNEFIFEDIELFYKVHGNNTRFAVYINEKSNGTDELQHSNTPLSLIGFTYNKEDILQLIKLGPIQYRLNNVIKQRKRLFAEYITSIL